MMYTEEIKKKYIYIHLSLFYDIGSFNASMTAEKNKVFFWEKLKYSSCIPVFVFNLYPKPNSTH